VPPIVTTVATTGAGVDELWDAVAAHREHLESTGLLERRRRERLRTEVREMVKARLVQIADNSCRGSRFDSIVDEQAATADPQHVAERLVSEILGVPEHES
jgi:LAO/AO transport system kinase